MRGQSLDIALLIGRLALTKSFRADTRRCGDVRPIFLASGRKSPENAARKEYNLHIFSQRVARNCFSEIDGDRISVDLYRVS